MTKVTTHCNVDLDAVCSVWAVRNFIPGYSQTPVNFVPANWPGEPGVDHTDHESDHLAVDISAGIKGALGDCAFAEIVRTWAPSYARTALAPLVEYVHAQDTTGVAETALFGDEGKAMVKFGINTVLNCLRRSLQNQDESIIEAMSFILDGWYVGAVERSRGEEVAKAALKLAEGMSLKHTVVLEDPAPPATNGVLFDRGAKAIVFQDGMNLGVIRSNQETFDLGRIVQSSDLIPEEEKESWFHHPAGFLSAHGTRKAPATTASAVDPWELGILVDEAICDIIAGIEIAEVLDRR